MVNIPFFHPHKDRTYVTLKAEASDTLLPALGHIGTVHHMETTESGDRKSVEYTGFITVRYRIEGEERHFHGHMDSFHGVDLADVPQDFIRWLEAEDALAEAAFTRMERDFAAAEKTRLREAAAYVANLAAVFKKSRDFWRSWKGTGTAPVDPQTGISSKDREPPAI